MQQLPEDEEIKATKVIENAYYLQLKNPLKHSEVPE